MPEIRAQGERKQNFLQGALILSLATVAVKIIGAVFKIPIQRMLEETGSAHFQVAYQIYSTLFILATAGLPVAISKMVSEAETLGRQNESKRIFNVAMRAFLVIGAVGSVLMFFGAPFLAKMMNDEGSAVPAIRAIAPAVFFVSVVCPFRGFHQGKGNMIPTAMSQVVEALGKLVFGVSLAWIIAKQGLSVEYQAAGAIGGVTIGTLLAAFFLWATGRNSVKIFGGDKEKKQKGILSRLMVIAIPITISSAVLSVTNLIDTSLVLGQLQTAAGFTKSMAQHYYGAYSWAITMFNLPPAFVLTVAMSVIPAIAAAKARKDHVGAAKTIESSFRITALLALPAAAGFMSLSWPIINLLYAKNLSENEIGGKVIDGMLLPNGVNIAAPLLFMLGIAVLFVCLVSLTNAILQSLGMVNIPLITMLIGAVGKIVCNLIFVGNPNLHINGAPIGTIVCYGLISTLNVLVIIRSQKTGLSILKGILRPLAAAAGMGFIAHGFYYLAEYLLGAKIGVILSILVGVVAYGIMIILFKAIPKEDWLLIPKGDKIVRRFKIT